MAFAKRILLFMGVNILVIATLSTVASVFGIGNYLTATGIDYRSLLLFCLLWGFGGAFISLLLSKQLAKWMMGVRIIPLQTQNREEQALLVKVHRITKQAGLEKMPEVGIYQSPEVNAFATGPSRNRSLIAVSTGLLSSMSEDAVEGVLAHEVAHIANGDMVTMTLVQGVVNAFVMFLARILAFFASQFVDEGKRGMVQFGVTIAAEIFLGILGMIVVASYSRIREFAADRDAAGYSGKEKMILALQSLKQHHGRLLGRDDDAPALATLKISGKAGGWLKLFATHPDLNERIRRLQTYG